jgi:hypothetical protein
MRQSAILGGTNNNMYRDPMNPDAQSSSNNLHNKGSTGKVLQNKGSS